MSTCDGSPKNPDRIGDDVPTNVNTAIVIKTITLIPNPFSLFNAEVSIDTTGMDLNRLKNIPKPNRIKRAINIIKNELIPKSAKECTEKSDKIPLLVKNVA